MTQYFVKLPIIGGNIFSKFMYGKREKVGKQLSRESLIMSCDFVEFVL